MVSSPEHVAFAEIRHKLSRAFEQRIKRGLLPYEGEWLNIAEIAARQRDFQRRARVQLWEVLLALASLGLMGGVLLVVVYAIMY